VSGSVSAVVNEPQAFVASATVARELQGVVADIASVDADTVRILLGVVADFASEVLIKYNISVAKTDLLDVGLKVAAIAQDLQAETPETLSNLISAALSANFTVEVTSISTPVVDLGEEIILAGGAVARGMSLLTSLGFILLSLRTSCTL